MVTIITLNPKKYIILFLIVLAFFIFFTNAENLNLAINESILFCVKSLIPSIFVFVIFSSFILYSSAFSDFLPLQDSSRFKQLGNCRKYFLEIILCSICGFVNGPKMISEDFRKNGGDEDEFSNGIILSSNAGLGFLVGCVGARLWNDTVFGLYLFLCQILTSLLLGKILLKTKKSKKIRAENSTKNPSNLSLSSAFSKSVSSSTLTLISICAFVIVFSCFLEILVSVFDISKDSNLYLILGIFCEFCKGSFLAVKFKNLILCAFFTGFCFGFGGVCVHFQTYAVCEGLPLNKKRFFFFKLVHGILCGALSILYVAIFKISPCENAISSLLRF